MSDARYRVIDGALYRRETTPYAYDLKVHSLGAYIEAVALPRYGWGEVGALSPLALSDAAMADGNIWVDGAWQVSPLSQVDLLDRAAMNRERSARRARAAVRKRVKLNGLDTMLTLTYRENMQDRSRIRRDFDVMLKRIRRVIPSFDYVCVFERQKRGAWHAHIACRRIQSHYLHGGVLVKSYDLLRALWRAVVGSSGGNVDVSRQRAVKRSTGRLAAYLSKYIGKGFEGAQDGDSYSASGSLPKPATWRHQGACLVEAGEALRRLCLELFDGPCEFYSASIEDTVFYCSLSPP